MERSIERAGIETHSTLTEIAHAAKRHWGYPERWMQLWRDVLTITPDYIAGNEVYVARLGDQIVGFYALLGSGAKLTLDHLWLAPAQIGTGIGRTLFKHAMATAKQLGATEIEIEAEPNAVGFYERMGAKLVHMHRTSVNGQARELPVYHCHVT